LAKTSTKNTSKSSLTCGACGNLKKSTNYYKSFNPIHKSGYLPYCKTCLKNMCLNNHEEIDVDKVKEMLRMIDRPFIYSIFEASCKDEKDTIGTYIKNIALNNKYDTWSDSIFEPTSKETIDIATSKANMFGDFVVTEAIVEKWGYGYTDEEYYYFEKKYKKLIDNYGEKTALHIEALLTYVRFRVKEELATAKNEIKEAKDWGQMASKAADDAKINVRQLSKSDLSGGVDLVPQIFEAVESKVGVIPIMPKLKEQPYDDADIIIWCVLNYLRRLEGKSRIEYREIWNFYDTMLEEHYKQQGYNKEMIKKEKEKRNSVFRDLGAVYKEPIYEEGEE
jgi:hypothetical protein